METTQLFHNLSPFYHHWAPLTWEIGFLEAPPSEIGRVALPWATRTQGPIRVSQVVGEGDDFLKQLIPLDGFPNRVIWCMTRSNWIARFGNGYRGSYATAPISYLSQQIGCRGLVVRCNPHKLVGSGAAMKGAYGIVQLELFGPQMNPNAGQNYLRSISVARDAGKRWRFHEFGNRLSFEETDKYRNANISQRFTPEMLVHYCDNLGIQLYSSRFYGPEAEIWDFMDSPADKRLSLQEAKAEVLLPFS